MSLAIEVCIACTLFKIMHGATLLTCSYEFFIKRWSTIALVIWDFIWTMNIIFRKMISWPISAKMLDYLSMLLNFNTHVKFFLKIDSMDCAIYLFPFSTFSTMFFFACEEILLILIFLPNVFLATRDNMGNF